MIPNQINERTGMRIGEPLIFTFICQSDALIGKKIDIQNVYGKKAINNFVFVCLFLKILNICTLSKIQ